MLDRAAAEDGKFGRGRSSGVSVSLACGTWGRDLAIVEATLRDFESINRCSAHNCIDSFANTIIISINVKKLQLRRVTHLKLQKSQKGDITHQHIA